MPIYMLTFSLIRKAMSTRIIVRHRLGGWLPQDHRLLQAWLDKKIAYVTEPSRTGQAFLPVIQEFQTLIETDPQVWMGFHHMFEQVPTKPPYDNDPTGKPQVSVGQLSHRPPTHVSTCIRLGIT